jgi:hypothetical protein
MKMKKIIITGDPEFSYRHRYLWEALSPYFEHLEVFSRQDSLNIQANAFRQKIVRVSLTGRLLLKILCKPCVLKRDCSYAVKILCWRI